MVVEYFMEWVHTASVRKREAAAGALVRAFLSPSLEDDERDDLEAALTILIEDNAPVVRLAIARTFGTHELAPRHMMCSLADDNNDISVVVLTCSPVFHDSELIDYFVNGNEAQQVAISCRLSISPELVTSICDMGCRDAVLGILENPVADFTGADLHQVAMRFGGDTEIRNSLLNQPNLDSRTRHILIGKLAEALGGFVRNKSWLSEARVNQAVAEACDRASIIFAAGAREEDIASVVHNLIAQERLTVAFLVRAICMGNITLVASALAELSGIKFARVEAILTRDRKSAFRAVYDRAGLPASAFLVFQTAISTWRRLLSSRSKINKARLPFLVTREVLEAYSSKPDLVDHDLLVLLRRLAAESARENSRAQAMEIAARKTPVGERIAAQKQAVIERVAQQAVAQAVSQFATGNQPQTTVKPNLKRVSEGVADPKVIEQIEAEFTEQYEGLVINDVGSSPISEMGNIAKNDRALDDLSSGLLHAADVRAA